MLPPEERHILRTRLALAEQIDGDEPPANPMDATLRLASHVVMLAFDDVGKRRQAQHAKFAGAHRAGQDATQLEKDIDRYKREFADADAAELQLIEAVCLPELLEGARVLKAGGGAKRLPPFCAELLRMRDASDC